MKSKLRKLFKGVSYVMLLWTILSGTYLALPQEYKEMIPNFNDLTALLSGGSLGILGSAILIIEKTFKRYDTKYLDVLDKFSTLGNKYLDLRNEVSDLKTLIKDVLDTNEKTVRLISLDLESKLSNPLVEEHIKEKLRGEGVGKEKEE